MTLPLGILPGGLFYLQSTIAYFAIVGSASIYGFWPKSVFSCRKNLLNTQKNE
nr:MAG TPA: hypothetical protein [Caudoviricetes sp.]